MLHFWLRDAIFFVPASKYQKIVMTSYLDALDLQKGRLSDRRFATELLEGRYKGQRAVLQDLHEDAFALTCAGRFEPMYWRRSQEPAQRKVM